MIGAYYETQPLDPIKGLADVSTQASHAHEAIRPLLKGTIGSFAPWGEQTTTGWEDYSAPAHNYTLFPMNAATLRQAESAASGNPVGMIGVLYRSPAPLEAVDDVMSQGPYEVIRGEAIYRLDDRQPLPTPQFLYLGKLMDEGEHDGRGSYEALEVAVKDTGGELVFVEPTDRTGIERPLPTAPLSVVVPMTQGEREMVAQNAAVTSPVPPSVTGGLTSLVAGVVGLAGGAFAGYHLFKQ